MNQQETHRVPLEKALILLEEGDSPKQGLRANKCAKCALTFFPPRKYCAHCTEPVTEEVLLEPRGKVVSYTFIQRKAPLSIIEAPYVLAEIDVGEGINNVYSVLHASPEEVFLGMRNNSDCVF